MELFLLVAWLLAFAFCAGYVKLGHWLLVTWNPMQIGLEDES